MEQDERVAADPSEGDTEQGAEAPAAAVLAGELAGAEEGVSEVDGPVRVAPSESAKKQDLEDPSPESDDEVAATSGGAEGEDRGAFGSPVAAHSAPSAMAAIARASPPDSYRRAPWRSRKQYSPKRFVAAPGSAGPGTRATTPPMPAGRGPRSAASEPVSGGPFSSTSAAVPWSPPPGENHRRGRFYGVLGASLALTVVSCDP